MIRLERVQFGYFLVVNVDTGEDLLVQGEFDFPPLASTFGWSTCHPCTDGTINCHECGATPGELISSAVDFLDDHIGDTAEDPGYFG
jgi:hypothetical protein